MGVLIVGATGGCGRHAYQACMKLGLTDVTCLVRDVPRARQVLGPQANLVQGDLLDPASLTEAMRGKQHVILTIGKTRGAHGSTSEQIDFQGAANAAQAAKLAGVKKLVHVTSNGVDSPNRWFVRALNYMSGMGLGWKLRGEQAIRDCGVPYVIVRPVGLKNKDEDRPVTIKQCTPNEWGVCMISRQSVGQICAQALVHSPESVTLNCREAAGSNAQPDWSTEYDWQGTFSVLQPDVGPLPCTFEDHVNAVQSGKLWVGGSVFTAACCVVYKALF
eukprot:TRINITY_DN33169_c0_g1_i1.p1 TRINITY_DN33169_c0_g1~~TRINITY_DN33169_c0_g1_i1.p1  ORF type:complete len:275 (-),score=43.80 TRINITY_DN33169_c0_g1_i1:3-827(-)